MDITGTELADTQFSGRVLDYDDNVIEVPGKGGASFANPMYDEAVCDSNFIQAAFENEIC